MAKDRRGDAFDNEAFGILKRVMPKNTPRKPRTDDVKPAERPKGN